MSFSDLLDGLDAAVSEHLCDPALWTPAGAAEAVALRVQPVVQDVIADLPGVGPRNTTRRAFEVAEAEFAAAEAAGRLTAGVRPKANDRLVFAGEALRIHGAPRREDEGRRWWTFEAVIG